MRWISIIVERGRIIQYIKHVPVDVIVYHFVKYRLQKLCIVHYWVYFFAIVQN